MGAWVEFMPLFPPHESLAPMQATPTNFISCRLNRSFGLG